MFKVPFSFFHFFQKCSEKRKSNTLFFIAWVLCSPMFLNLRRVLGVLSPPILKLTMLRIIDLTIQSCRCNLIIIFSHVTWGCCTRTKSHTKAAKTVVTLPSSHIAGSR